MALVFSPWFGRGCGRRARPFSFGSPSLFTDLVVVKVPQMAHRQASCSGRGSAMANARFVQWSETPDSNVFTLRLPGLKKENLQIQVEDDRTLYISYSTQPKAEEAKDEAKDPAKDEAKDAAEDVKEAKEGDQAAPADTSEQTKRGGCSFMRKFKLPENADLEQIKAEVTNETLTVTVPKRKPKAPETRNIEVSEGGPASATNPSASSSANPSDPPASKTTTA